MTQYQTHGNLVMLELLFGTEQELAQLIDKRPERYSRFAGYIGTRA